MKKDSPNATVYLSGKDLFVGVSPSGHALTLDTDHERSVAPTPMELLMIALGSCTGVDVASILEKKRIPIAAYRIEITGERRDEHPRSFKKLHVHHIITGQNIPETAVARAIELSEEKYCSVAATLRPTAEITSSFEILEAEPTGD